jgi:hypothetical protein
MRYVFDRLKEPSTWRGAAILAGAFGLRLQPDAIAQIGTAVGAAISVIEILRKET